jgi:hypothetical protein
LLSGAHAGASEKNAPALTVPQVRLLLTAVLPRREFDPEEALALLHYVQRRNAVAAAAHRKRQEAWMVDRERIVTVHAA